MKFKCEHSGNCEDEKNLSEFTNGKCIFDKARRTCVAFPGHNFPPIIKIEKTINESK